jgi:nicotinamidase-related amidase
MKHALILVDIQQDYFPNGRMEVAGAVEAGRMAKRLLEYFRQKNLPIIHIQHIAARPNATFLLPNTDGIDFHDHVKPLPNEAVIKKHFPNSFRDTDLEEHLRSQGIEDLVICGMMSHMCIDATTRAAFDKGYTCMVAHDACATRNMIFNGLDIAAPYVHGAYMAALGAVYAKVLTTDEVFKKLPART